MSEEKKQNVQLRRRLRDIVRISARECLCEGRLCLDFSSNNYLALANDPRIVEESINWMRRLGSGASASRLISGSLREYLELEERIARWKGSERVLMFGSGYLANLGILQALLSRSDTLFMDKLNHNSLANAAILSRADLSRYRHCDLSHLSEKRSAQKTAKDSAALIASDTVFSMDGDLADVPGLAKIAAEHGDFLFLDEAHASGVFGENGSGLAGEAAREKNCICMGTFSKALGSYGAYVSCSAEIREILVNKSSTFIYSTALPPGVCGAISAAVKLMQTDEFREIRKNLLGNAIKLADEIRRLGFDVGKSASPIIPVIIGDEDDTVRISQSLMDEGIMALPIRPPTVPNGSSRLRISINSAHSPDDLERLLLAIAKFAK